MNENVLLGTVIFKSLLLLLLSLPSTSHGVFVQKCAFQRTFHSLIQTSLHNEATLTKIETTSWHIFRPSARMWPFTQEIFSRWCYCCFRLVLMLIIQVNHSFVVSHIMVAMVNRVMTFHWRQSSSQISLQNLQQSSLQWNSWWKIITRQSTPYFRWGW